MNSAYPHLTFHLNQSLDCQMANLFLGPIILGGINFADEVITDHPGLKPAISLTGKDKTDFINRYLKGFYSSHRNQLLSSRKIFQQKWDKVEQDFFKLANKYLDQQIWPDGKYKSYISIFHIGPRFLETKEFQTCWLLDKMLIWQVAHELLHFQFYNLIGKLHLANKYSENEIWHLSEIFNDIVQNEKDFIDLQGYTPGVCYPEHKKCFTKYINLWNGHSSIEEFIDNALLLVKQDFYG